MSNKIINIEQINDCKIFTFEEYTFLYKNGILTVYPKQKTKTNKLIADKIDQHLIEIKIIEISCTK